VQKVVGVFVRFHSLELKEGVILCIPVRLLSVFQMCYVTKTLFLFWFTVVKIWIVITAASKKVPA
jgi:hypothetical protein